jgi:hypothetical protein
MHGDFARYPIGFAGSFASLVKDPFSDSPMEEQKHGAHPSSESQRVLILAVASCSPGMYGLIKLPYRFSAPI